MLEDYVNNTGKVSKEVLYELSYCYYMQNQDAKAIEGFKQLSNEKDSMGQNSMYLLGGLYLKTNQKKMQEMPFNIVHTIAVMAGNSKFHGLRMQNSLTNWVTRMWH